MTLSPNQGKTIEAELKGKGRFPVLVVYIPTDADSSELSFELEQLLKRVGWNAERRSLWEVLRIPPDNRQGEEFILGGFFVGVSELDTPAPGAESLLAALKHAHVPIDDGFQAFGDDPEKRCCLFVGAQPLENRTP